MKQIIFNQALLDTHLVVDVRTPLEFEEDHIPGALNIPLLDNEQRVEIGILHKQNGPHVARRRGLELTAQHFPEIVRPIDAAAADVASWFIAGAAVGAGRSPASLILPVIMPCNYRAATNPIAIIFSFFEKFKPSGPMVIMHGLTGVGKTDFILGLQGENCCVVDLEGLACHRGSAFGELGITQALSRSHSKVCCGTFCVRRQGANRLSSRVRVKGSAGLRFREIFTKLWEKG